MIIARRTLLAGTAAALAAPALRPARAAERVKLVVGTQDIALQESVNASGVLDGIDYEFQWATLPGPAAQLSGLYSKAIDVGLMGDTSLIIEQGRAKIEWTAETAPLQIVAGWRNPDRAYPPIVTAVRTSANINSLADLRGRKWAYNFGGFNYLQYVLTRIKAGLKVADIEPVQLVDTNAAAAAFNTGRVDVFSGGLAPVKEAVDKGEARVLIVSDELDIPSLTVFTARRDVIQDAGKHAALADFLARVRKHWAWYPHHIAQIEQQLQDKLKQSPARAKYYAAFNASVFYPLDDALAKREQHIADTLFEAGDIAKRIDVNIEFSRAFNAATTGAA